MDTCRPWYVLHVRHQHELKTANHIHLLDWDVYVPTYTTRRHWTDRVKTVTGPLFPGYVFCRMDWAERWRVLVLKAVIGPVRLGTEPAMISQAVVNDIRRLAESDLSPMPHPVVKKGDQVAVIAGPLRGLRGVVVWERNATRVVVSVEAIQRAVAVELDRDMLVAEPRPVRTEVLACVQ